MPMFAPLVLLLLSAQQPDIDVGKGPEPSPNAISWELDFKFLDPRRIEVQVPGRAAPEVYWYLVYTVTNKTDRTQRFFPTFQLVTEDLVVLDTDMGINKVVFEAIRERNLKTHPDLVTPTQAIGELRSGEDYARESVAIWRATDVTVNNFTIYVAGLSGETRTVRNPAWSKPAGKPAGASEGDAKPGSKDGAGPGDNPAAGRNEPRNFTLRKTLEIRYSTPGSPEARSVAEVERRSVRWVMR